MLQGAYWTVPGKHASSSSSSIFAGAPGERSWRAAAWGRLALRRHQRPPWSPCRAGQPPWPRRAPGRHAPCPAVQAPAAGHDAQDQYFPPCTSWAHWGCLNQLHACSPACVENLSRSSLKITQISMHAGKATCMVRNLGQILPRRAPCPPRAAPSTARPASWSGPPCSGWVPQLRHCHTAQITSSFGMHEGAWWEDFLLPCMPCRARPARLCRARICKCMQVIMH